MNGRDLTLGALAGLAMAGMVAQRRSGSRSFSPRAPRITVDDYRAITTRLKHPTPKNAAALSDEASVFLDFAIDMGLDVGWGDESETTLGPEALRVIRDAVQRVVEQNIEVARQSESFGAHSPYALAESNRLLTLLRKQGIESDALRQEASNLQEIAGWWNDEARRALIRLHVSLAALRDMVTPQLRGNITHDRGGGDVVLAGSWQDGVRTLWYANTDRDDAVFAPKGARIAIRAPDGGPLLAPDFRDRVDAARMVDRVDAADYKQGRT